MDDVVIRAMGKWPNVPDVFGWLSLDQRGNWRVRGEKLTHRGAVAFIGRNYAVDEQGRWFFQNGPQRVFATLEYTPWVNRLQTGDRLSTHTGVDPGEPTQAFLDDVGRLLLLTASGPGLLDDRDLVELSDRFLDANGRVLAEEVLESALEGDVSRDRMQLQFAGHRLALEQAQSAEVPRLFGFQANPETGY